LTSLLVTARLIATMDEAHRTIEDGAIAIEDGAIVAVGPREEIQRRFPNPKRRIGGERFVALPGFVDGHSHAGHALVRTLGGDDFPAWRQA